MNKKYFPLFFIVFLSRIPFLWLGYGVEEDSWGIALAAFHTHLSGMYEPSRFPGHPVQELLYSALWGAGPIVFNGLSAFFSAIAVVFFAKILNHLNFNHYFLAALALAFVPVFYISSTYTIDFVWTEAFVLISFYYLLKNKLILTGVFLGLAVGCRITSGVMLLPFLMIIWEQKNGRKNIIQLVKMAAPMCIVAFIAFIPLMLQFGLSFFMYYDQFPYPSFAKVFYKMIPGVFGCIGVVSIAICLLYILVNKKKIQFGGLFSEELNRKLIWAGFIVLILFSISYLRLPQKSGYMISVLPFVIILFGYFLNARLFKFLCISFIISPFICGINLTDKLRGAEYSKLACMFTVSGQEIFFDPLSGPIMEDYSKRKQKDKYVMEVNLKIFMTSEKTVVIAGWWYNQLMVKMLHDPKNEKVILESYINEEKMNEYKTQGYKIVYLPEQDLYNDQMYKMIVTDKLAAPF